MLTRAAALDEADPLAWCADAFVPAGEGAQVVRAYLDGNSLGRPLRATAARLEHVVAHDWGTRLIRSWDEQWMDLPTRLGDRIGRVLLGAAPGQTVVADSTTVLLYKLVRAAMSAAPAGRTRIVLDSENFPTDRYVVAGIAAELGLELDWLHPDPAAGVRPEEVAAVVDERTALVVLSQVAYKSAWLADLPAITQIAHDAGALVLWDLCHSAGVVAADLDANQVDLAVGCSYKFLNGGPGAPAFAYVARRHLEAGMRQPIQGWMGHAQPFVMGPEHVPAPGIRSFISGTPAILGMAGIADTVDLAERAGLAAIRAKSVALTEFTIEAYDDVLAPRGVRLGTVREADRRGSHVSLGHDRFRQVVATLWGEHIVPDFREPDAIRLGLAPLSTRYTEAALAVTRIAELLDAS
nr:aminotransferase class V-fold PLP-dependent enzyme [Kineosphaera limosa]